MSLGRNEDIVKQEKNFQASAAYGLGAPENRQPYGHPETFILNEQPAAKGQFPFQAGIFVEDDFCGGSLISQTWVLTAGICVRPYRLWTVVLGAHNISIVREPGRVTLLSNKAIAHEGFDVSSTRSDVAVIQLPQDATPTVSPSFIDVPCISVHQRVGCRTSPSEAFESASQLLSQFLRHRCCFLPYCGIPSDSFSC